MLLCISALICQGICMCIFSVMVGGAGRVREVMEIAPISFSAAKFIKSPRKYLMRCLSGLIISIL